jgi:hypothetical protein
VDMREVDGYFLYKVTSKENMNSILHFEVHTGILKKN